MELKSFDKFHQLRKLDHDLSSIGFCSEVRTGDINRFASRIRLAKNFRGINLEGYSQETNSGYDAFFLVFLTHSALEVFMEINSLKLDMLTPLMTPYNSEKVIREFVEKDKQGLLYDFLYKKLVDKKLKVKLSDCRSYKSTNVAHISASIRHIFAHGHLCAHSNGINPKNVYSICVSISEFLLNFMDAEFTKKVEEYYKKVDADII
ncbi:hypothetical protein G7B40_037825 [Aetokthonos hydrillicola Thurmond2011]|jgi:hypothetical protein|uniref:Uncharacterized protein n=1 Tax=Aetokthonos hydrillicola Thurmond2011 TaxID=2712845 RepID=A0AAP5IHH5_9CYAN|nr:hypothetical protein [Aetokthonos hydrillicola]MBO3463281.1 hypothetical protein [Aetokthonos hydrillicola CCALA 1050]MBW4589772.1 hypothetical protein [Aetokthonos hydrillicola CCALA 1050]MDR9900268.1 hypothetical protein [Aetokthonos hydrillicola Thurmond2011]